MVNKSDSLGPNVGNPLFDRDARTYTPAPTQPPVQAGRNRVPWPDGRFHRHEDGTVCDAGQNEVYEKTVGTPFIDMRQELTCWPHHQHVTVAARYRHEEEPGWTELGECDATPEEVTQYPGEAPVCTLHELPVEKVWG